MIPSARYPAKVLLFGEYSVLSGSDALAIPYASFSGRLRYSCIADTDATEAKESQKVLMGLYQYLEKNSRKCLSQGLPDLERLRNDLISGLYFESDIPYNYGIGSSAALSAAIYDSYFDQTKQMTTDQVITCLSMIESYFHQESSGIDPLVSLFSMSFHLRDGHPTSVNLNKDWINSNLNIFLIDSGLEGNTKQGIQEGHLKKITNEYIALNNKIVQAILRKQSASLFEMIQDLGNSQLSIFEDLFPPQILELAKTGADRKDFTIKLCGSGGGGYFLLFTKSKEIPNAVEKSGLSVLNIT